MFVNEPVGLSVISWDSKSLNTSAPHLTQTAWRDPGVRSRGSGNTSHRGSGALHLPTRWGRKDICARYQWNAWLTEIPYLCSWCISKLSSLARLHWAVMWGVWAGLQARQQHNLWGRVSQVWLQWPRRLLWSLHWCLWGTWSLVLLTLPFLVGLFLMIINKDHIFFLQFISCSNPSQSYKCVFSIKIF